jgi:hypothetical protein
MLPNVKQFTVAAKKFQQALSPSGDSRQAAAKTIR